MDYSGPLTQRINVIIGTITAVLTYFFGGNWFLFAGFLLLNVLDWVTGWMKSKLTGKENSTKGTMGIIKKVGYWVMLMVSFEMSAIFVSLGESLNVNLEITELLGWFVLASLIVNEIRSILENLVEAGYHVPSVLTKGLEVAEKAIVRNGDSEGILHIDTSDPEKDLWNFEASIPLEEIAEKDYIVLKVNKDNFPTNSHE